MSWFIEGCKQFRSNSKEQFEQLLKDQNCTSRNVYRIQDSHLLKEGPKNLSKSTIRWGGGGLIWRKSAVQTPNVAKAQLFKEEKYRAWDKKKPFKTKPLHTILYNLRRIFLPPTKHNTRFCYRLRQIVNCSRSHIQNIVGSRHMKISVPFLSVPCFSSVTVTETQCRICAKGRKIYLLSW